MTEPNGQDILFLYECKDNNPNGDPLDDNRPRLDLETGALTVSDARIKRTVRDYLHEVKGEEILIRDSYNEKGFLKEGRERCDDFFELADIKKPNQSTNEQFTNEHIVKLRNAITQTCIDARLFGAVLPLGKGSVSVQLTGPVQFNSFNRSLNEASVVLRQGTAAFAGKSEALQKTFSERHIVHYALIAAEGVFNPFSAQATGATEQDLERLFEGLWYGTSWLNSNSKSGQTPLGLIVVEYKDGYRLGDLSGRVKLSSNKADKKLRSMDDYALDMQGLVDGIIRMKDKGRVSRVRLQLDERLKTMPEDVFQSLQDAGLQVDPFDL